jgi:hypothetical protein
VIGWWTRIAANDALAYFRAESEHSHVGTEVKATTIIVLTDNPHDIKNRHFPNRKADPFSWSYQISRA